MNQPYESYKNSGIDWLGDIPSHWEVSFLKRYCEGITDGSHFSPETQYEGYNYISVKDLEDRYIDFDNCKKISEADFIQLAKNGCQPQMGDILLSKDGTIGKAIVVEGYNDYVVLSSLGIITPNSQYYNSYYLRYFLISGVCVDQMFRLIQGSALTRLTIDKIKHLQITLPPLAEQRAIAAYLDRKTAQIDQLVAQKEQLLDLLQKKRQAIINEAVTRGLDANAPKKDSGIEWLGEIPAHWEVKKLKHLVEGRLEYGANESAEYDDPEYPRYIRITDFGENGKLRSETFKSLPPEVAEEYLLSEGDILFARSGATVGKTFQFKNYNGVACFAGYLIKATPNKHLVSSDFLYLFTKSFCYENWKSSVFSQATIQNIGADKYKMLSVPIPPIDEQCAIVGYLEGRMIQIDQIIIDIKTQLAHLKTYRQSLISEVVTGKIDVRAKATAEV